MAADPDGELPIVPLAIAYARCVASCMAQSAVSEAIFGDIQCFDVGDNAKDCALDCLNPFNWGGKNILAKANNNKQTRKAIDGLRKHVEKHLEKIRQNPNSRDVLGWEKEIRAALERIERLTKRLP
jgi:hypothetical protein